MTLITPGPCRRSNTGPGEHGPLNQPIRRTTMKRMNAAIRTLAWILLPAALLGLSACSSSPPPKGPEKVESFQYEGGSTGFGGGVITESNSTNATVMAVDPAQRTLVLQFPDNSRVTQKAAQEVPNFNQIHVGDQVMATIAPEGRL